MEGWKSMERRKSMERPRDNDVPVISNPAQVLYSFDLHSSSSNESSAQLARVLGPEPDLTPHEGIAREMGVESKSMQ